MDDIYFQPEKIPKVDSAIIKRLSILRPWRSFLAIFLDWLIIALCVFACVRFSFWLYPVAFIIIGSRFHALEALMHEATHYRLHANKKINDLIGELLIWPLGTCMLLYRDTRHFSHHKNIGTGKDAHVFQTYMKLPGLFTIPQSPPDLLKNCAKVAARFSITEWLRQLKRTAMVFPRFAPFRGKFWIAFQMLTLAGIIAGSILFDWKIALYYFLFFILPTVWTAVFSFYLRLLAEHFGIPHQPPAMGSGIRTVVASWPIRVIFWPHNLNYHIEHHWYPSVPFYNLPTLHKLLRQSPDIRQRMHVTHGVTALMRELTAVPS